VTVRDPLMESGPSHEAVLTSTEFRISLQQDSQCKDGVNTHLDGTNPFRLLLGTERSPFSPYRGFRTGARIIRTRHAYCGPKNGKGERKNFVGEHDQARCCVNKLWVQFIAVSLIPTPHYSKSGRHHQNKVRLKWEENRTISWAFGKRWKSALIQRSYSE
jgi:hypothetical protein